MIVDTEDVVVVLCRMGVVLLEELLFLFILNTKYMVKIFESVFGLFQGELSFDEMVVLSFAVFVTQNFVSLTDVFEFFLGIKFVICVFARMVLNSEFVVSLADLWLIGFRSDSEDSIEAFDLFGLTHLK